MQQHNLKKNILKKNDDNFNEDFEWLEKLIDHGILSNKDNLCNNKQIRISAYMRIWDSPYLIKMYDSSCSTEGEGRVISKENFQKALEILKNKYKENGWKISFKIFDLFFKTKAIYIQRSNSFWKSFFSKKNKKYPSVLEELEKKYSQE